MAKVFLPKGMRDLLPQQMHRRNRVIGTVRRVFERFGFEPLETPAMERIETLLGKSGEEADRLIFRVLKRGEGGERGEADQALRYDLTVPLARVVAMNPDLPMPFKRYQIQPVWRADRPQRGRFREFYQCDVDIVGSESRLAEAECLALVDAALTELGFPSFTIRLNDRRILRAMAAAAGIEAGARPGETDMLVAIDKLDKIGESGVRREFLERGFSAAATDRVFAMLGGEPVPGAEDAQADLDRIRDWAAALGADPRRIQVDRTLARGLDYYTGPVFETVLTTDGGPMGSVSGGGRYDGLIGMFCDRRIPAVGVSLGLERLIVLMEELGMLGDAAAAAEVVVTVFSHDHLAPVLAATRAFREAGVPTEFVLDPGKLGKQLKAAAKAGNRWAVVIGPDEAAAGQVQLKDLGSGSQETLPLAQAVAQVTARRA